MKKHTSARLLLPLALPWMVQDPGRSPTDVRTLLRNEGAGESWTTRVEAEIAAQEYAIHFVPARPGLWSAPNRAHDFRARWTVRGLEVFPREIGAEEESTSWSFELRTTRIGRAGGELELGAPELALEGSRLVTTHACAREWFENSPEGLEQGWTIATRPPGEGPLEIEVAVGGGFTFEVESGRHSALLVEANGQPRLRYRGLRAHDAAGTELAAAMSATPRGLRLEIQDARAVYPLEVDPILSGLAWSTGIKQGAAHVGASVAWAGDVNGDDYDDVIVGAPEYDRTKVNEDRAFLYLGSANGPSASYVWSDVGNQIGANFGALVASAGDVNGDNLDDVLVGAPRYDETLTIVNKKISYSNDQGRALLYLGTTTGLATKPVVLKGKQVGAQFGFSAASGHFNSDNLGDLVIGAPQFDNGQTDEGRAYLYRGSVSNGVLGPSWSAEGNSIYARFGYSIASGDVNNDTYDDVIIGAPLYTNGQGQDREGRAYLFLGQPNGFQPVPSWSLEGDANNAYFGYSVAAGDVDRDGFDDLIVGAPHFRLGQSRVGRTFAFYSELGVPSLQADWIGEGEQNGEGFGWSISSGGDFDGDGTEDLVIGASGFKNGQNLEGRALVYRGQESVGLSSSPSWIREGDQEEARFGWVVAGDGDGNGDGHADVLVGAVYWGSGGLANGEGKAFLFDGQALGLSSNPAWITDGGAEHGLFVASAGDVDGDGFDEVLVGSLYGASLYMGTIAGPLTTPSWTVSDSRPLSVAGAGDVNHDGFDDVIVGDYDYHDSVSLSGAARLYLGSMSGLSPGGTWIYEPEPSCECFGASVASAGDVDDDGYDDVLIADPCWAPENATLDQLETGKVWLFRGSVSGLEPGFLWSVAGDQGGAFFGLSVASAGDLDANDHDDILVGQVGWDSVPGLPDNHGRAFVFKSFPGGISISPDWTVVGAADQQHVGASVAGVGDVNGDDLPDVVVGEGGHARLYLNSPLGLATTAAWVGGHDQVPTPDAVVAAAGDVNKDGYADVIVGLYAISNPEHYEGIALVYHGSPSGLSTLPAWEADGDQADSFFGWSVAGAGDVNGDGFGDVIIGALYFDSAVGDEGRAYIYLGNERP